MELAVSILSSAGVSAALTAALVFLCKTTITERLRNAIKSEYDLKLENYKNDLSIASSREIESLKAQLQIATMTHQIQFTSLHEKISDTVAGVYARIVKLRRAVADYVKIMESSDDPTKEDRRKVVGDRFGEFHEYYQPSKIYLPKAITGKIDELETLLFDTAYDFMWRVEMPESRRSSGDGKAWTAADRAIAEKVPPVLVSLEDAFRSLLGHSDPDAIGLPQEKLTVNRC